MLYGVGIALSMGIVLLTVYVFTVEVPVAKQKILDLPLNNDDMSFANNAINNLFNVVTVKEIKFQGVPIESFTREYLIKMLYIYCSENFGD